MKKEILAENFRNASNDYSTFSNALMERFEADPIMTCLLSHLHQLAQDYYYSMMDIYKNGHTVDEVLRGKEAGHAK